MRAWITMLSEQECPPDIHTIPFPEGCVPPPWYRPLSEVDKGLPRLRTRIAAGLVIDNEEGRQWFFRAYGTQLTSDQRQDLNIPL